MPQSRAAATLPECAIDIDGLTVDRAGRTILRTGRWQLAVGSHGLIRGPSGAGKTTLLHLLAGLEPVEGGVVRVLGTSLGDLGTRARDRFRATNIGLVFQDFHLLPALNVDDNVHLPLWFAGVGRDTTSAARLLERLGIGHLGRRRPHRLSQGEKQRVAIARAVINRPRLILADEPTSALDDDNAMNVLELLRMEAGQAGASLVIASHDQRLLPDFDNHLVLEPPR